jgi:sirohydrochlorin ferrochelatase
MQEMLGPEVDLQQAVMERRGGAAYDFNGELLEQVLSRAAEADERTTVALSLLFLSPGRHAGQGGDIDQICRSVRQHHPRLRIISSSLVAEHPDLTGILLDRLRSGLGVTEIPL